MKLITEFEIYALKVYALSELDKTTSEDDRAVTYTLLFQGDEHKFINLKQVDDDYFRFEMYYHKARISADYFFENETPEEQMTTLKLLFDYTLDAYKNCINYIY